MKKNKLLKFLWNFWWYRLKVFKIEKYKLNKIFKSNSWYIIYLNIENIDEFKKELFVKKNLAKFWDDTKITIISRRDFINWFENNKNYRKKYLLINNINHCKYEYRYIRFSGLESYILK
ncbi:hypothetical protein [Malacoplasma muris]|uniref:hypothetical protein n=1 Tax=Malacoplasma muris TaxID=2119 RepID=UPI00398E9738